MKKFLIVIVMFVSFCAFSQDDDSNDDSNNVDIFGKYIGLPFSPPAVPSPIAPANTAPISNAPVTSAEVLQLLREIYGNREAMLQLDEALKLRMRSILIRSTNRSTSDPHRSPGDIRPAPNLRESPYGFRSAQNLKGSSSYQDKLERASQGDVTAMYELGEMLETLEPREAIEWFGKARQGSLALLEETTTLIRQEEIAAQIAARDVERRKEEYDRAQNQVRQWENTNCYAARTDVRDIIAKHQAAARLAETQLECSRNKHQQTMRRLNELKNRRNACLAIITNVDHKSIRL